MTWDPQRKLGDGVSVPYPDEKPPARGLARLRRRAAEQEADPAEHRERLQASQPDPDGIAFFIARGQLYRHQQPCDCGDCTAARQLLDDAKTRAELLERRNT